MAGKGAVLAIRIISDASKAGKGFDDAAGRVARFQGGLDRASAAAGGVLAAVGAVATQAYKDASALEQSSGAVASVYGKHSAAIVAQAEAAADAVGLSQNAYQELSSVLGAQLSSMGYAGKELTDQNQALIQTGADLAATFGGSTSDAVAAISSLMRGERDPIEKYGIAISQAAVDAQTLALGLDTSTPAAKRAADAQATLALLTQQSSAAQGAFAREADTAAGQTERAKAAFENASAQLGQALLPLVTAGAQKLAALAGMVSRNSDVIIPLTVGIGGLAAAILVANAVLRAYTTVTRVMTAVQGIHAAVTGKAKAATLAQSAAVRAAAVAQGIWNAVVSANPLMLIVVAIAAVVAAVVLAYRKFESFRDLVQGIGRILAGAFDAVVGAIEWVIDKLSFIGDAAAAVSGLFSTSATVAVTPEAAGSVSGLFGATAVPAPAGLYGASMTALTGGGSTAGQGFRSGPTTVVNITVQGAVDPHSTARQIRRILADDAVLTGRSMTVVTR